MSRNVLRLLINSLTESSYQNCLNISKRALNLSIHQCVAAPNYKKSDLKAIKKLEELLKFGPLEARDIIYKGKTFSGLSADILSENYHACKNAGISDENLKQNPEILAKTEIASSVLQLRILPYDVNITAPLLLLPAGRLQAFINEGNVIHRIMNISKILEISEHEVCKWLSKRPFLISLGLNHIEKNVQVLTDHGISKEEIVKDLWVLKYNANTINQRLRIAKANKIQPIKTWLVRAQYSIFENHIRRQSDNKLILGDNSLNEYLSEKLECSQAISKYITSKHPALQSKSLKKMNEMIDFLLFNGFTKLQICRTPKILLHSMETIKKRLKEIGDLGTKLDTLSVLTKSRKQFEQFLESFKLSKVKKEMT